MAKRVEFQVGDEVAVVGMDGHPWRSRSIISSLIRGGWYTTGDPGHEPTQWSVTGLVRDNRFGKLRIVPMTAALRRMLVIAGHRARIERRESWLHVTPEQIEAIAKIMGWE